MGLRVLHLPPNQNSIVKFANWTKTQNFPSFHSHYDIIQHCQNSLWLPWQEKKPHKKTESSQKQMKKKWYKLITILHLTIELLSTNQTQIKSMKKSEKINLSINSQTFTSSLRVTIDVLQQELEIRSLSKDCWWIHIHIWYSDVAHGPK
jgi:hypothetical protein